MTVQEEIIKGCKEYNSHYQRALYLRYSSLMMAVCVRYTSNREDAKDILQEGFIKVFDKIRSYKNEGSFEGWMTRIFINTAIDQIRKSRKTTFTDIEQISLSDNLIAEESYIPSLEDNPRDYSYEELMEAINSLSEEFRIVFNMAIIENYSHREIAELLMIKEETSRTRLIRAKNKVKMFLLGKEKNKFSVVRK